MKVYRGVVISITDPSKSGRFQVHIPELLDRVWVTYVSPTNNMDAGLFFPPTPNSEVLILNLDIKDSPHGEAGYYYLGSIVGQQRFLGTTTPNDEGDDLSKNPQSGKNISLGQTEINYAKSFGTDGKFPPTLPLPLQDAYANEVTPSKRGIVDTANNALILADQKRGDKGNSWMNIRARLQSGTGKVIDLIDTPAQDHIRVTTGKVEGAGEDYFLLGGRMTGMGAESNNIAAGEFRVDSHGPTNIVSRECGLEFRANGLNINIINTSEGEQSPDPKGREMVDKGGGNAKTSPKDRVPPYLNKSASEYKNLPQASEYAGGQAHTDPNKPGTGGDPTDHGKEEFGCVNIRSDWNNLNLEAFGEDSVIRINAPSLTTKIVVTTGGTVDIIANGKISLTSGEKIELNAPNVDINSLNRVDID